MEHLGIEGPGSASVDVAANHADLGLPLPHKTRWRFVKRLFVRANWTTTEHQIIYNEAIVEALAQLSHAVEITRTATASDVGNRLGVYQQAITDVQQRIGELERLLAASGDDLADLRARIAEVAQRQTTRDALARAGTRSPPTHGEPRSVHESLLQALEDRFRPPSERRRAADDHLLRVIDAVGEDGQVLDLGCGTGEWLQALRDAGLDARGVDTNAVAIEQCTAAGLDVATEDALEHLKRADEASLAAITAFHLVEHLPPSDLVDLLDWALRALRPGGLLVVETPNPLNLRVGAATFWLDPTHVRPLPPALLEFIARNRGFADLEVEFLHPAGDDLDWGRVDAKTRAPFDPFASRVVELLAGAQDYALFARRSSAGSDTN